MTIKAYHYVPASAMKQVLHQGEILPSSERVDPSVFMWDCQNTMNEIRREIKFNDLEPNENTFAALYDWADQEVQSLEEWQREIGVEETHRQTEFYCIDLLAGDLDRVFLSVGNWVRWAPSHTGFVFDAEELVRKGGGIRTADLALAYIAALQGVLMKQWESQKNAREAFERVLQKVVRANTARKEEAKEWLHMSSRSLTKAALPEGGRAELVWEGSLPLKLATEVWREGRRVAV